MRRLQKRSNFRENQSKTSVRGKESILVSGKLSLYKTNETDRQKRGSFFVVLPQIFISINLTSSMRHSESRISFFGK